MKLTKEYLDELVADNNDVYVNYHSALNFNQVHEAKRLFNHLEKELKGSVIFDKKKFEELAIESKVIIEKIEEFGNTQWDSSDLYRSLYYSLKEQSGAYETREKFRDYLTKELGESSEVDNYINRMMDLENWLIKNKVWYKGYSIWKGENKIEDIDRRLKNGNSKEWEAINKNENGFYNNLWNKWIDFNQMQKDPIEVLIESYKSHIRKTRLEDEVYKWKLVEENVGKPNTSAINFTDEVKSTKFGNLLYAMSIAVLYKLASERPEELRGEFENLFDENKSLISRIDRFSKETLKIYKTTDGEHSHHQDERSMATYLTYHDPTKYTFYKSSFYKKYCDYLGIKSAKKGGKYIHYLELVNHLIENYIINDNELINLVKEFIPDYYDGSNQMILAQDILYEMFDKKGEEHNCWIFQGNPKYYRITDSLRDGALNSWTVKVHKGKIKPGDKVIVWITGEFSGCYALASVTSEIENRLLDKAENNYFKTLQKDEPFDQVWIRIDVNLYNKPILWNKIKELPEFSSFKAGNRGTNFTATKEQYEVLLAMANEESEYQKIVKQLDPSKYKEFIELVKRVVKDNNIKRDSKLVAFTIRKNKNRLVFMIASRYVLTIEKKGDNPEFCFTSYEKYSENSGKFSDYSEKVEAYWNNVDDMGKFQLPYFEYCSSELKKDYASPFRKISNPDFMNVIFGYQNTVDEPQESYAMQIKEPLNQIIFGPPGTGKTYTLKTKYFPEYSDKETSLSSEQNFINVVNECTWWQVIAIALIEIKKGKVDDVLENEWVKQKAELSDSKSPRATVWGKLLAHTVLECENVKVKKRQNPAIFYKTDDKYWEILEEEVKEQAPEIYDIMGSVNNFKPNPDKEIKRYVFTTFHQSFSYEDFIEGIKPKMDTELNEDGELSYAIEPGIFKQICARAEKDPENSYAIFIDEINRGNVSQIFGELITLIEPDKRSGGENPMSATLPYSKKAFSVPSNLHIYGTMNTADRSVEALDTALRRRFSFIEMPPDPKLISTKGKTEGGILDGIDLVDLLETINKRIEKLVDKDHMIGHSYFLSVSDLNDLKNVFQNKIIPLLQEYFYGDFAKIGLVLGQEFFKNSENYLDDSFFAKFRDYDASSLLERPVYHLKNVNDMNDDEFVGAINTLFGESEIQE